MHINVTNCYFTTQNNTIDWWKNADGPYFVIHTVYTPCKSQTVFITKHIAQSTHLVDDVIFSNRTSCRMGDQVQTFREYLSNYNRLAETCFVNCIHDLTSREVGTMQNLLDL